MKFHFIILSVVFFLLTVSKAQAQVGVVTTNITLNESIENFVNNPNCNEDELSSLVHLIQKTGDLRQGLRIMNVAVQRFPNSYYAHYMRGFYNRNLEQFEEAVSDFTKAISIEPRYAEAYLGRGECLKVLNRFHEAVSDFNSAIEESDKLYATGLQYQGIEFAKPFALVGLGKYNEVCEWINSYIGDDYYDVACLYSKMKDKDMTIKYIRKALENGYSDINFIKVDNCMKWIKDNDQFIKIIQEYQQ